jgi:lysyl-tRNA synthetase class II
VMTANRVLDVRLIVVTAVKGCPGRTDKGELSVMATELILLTPCMHDLPSFNRLSEKVRLD